MSAKAVFVLCLVLCILHLHEAVKGKKLIVVLIDGCRWDYITDPNLKGIPRIIKNGVSAPFVYPIYPSVSYPNWYTIVTGLYAENHGFVNNVMYDPSMDEFFLSLPDTNSTNVHWWDEAEPIWITAERNNLKTGLYWWAGCEVEIKGLHPTICERHRYGPGTEDEKIDFIQRIDDLVEMFKPSRTRPSKGSNDGLSLALMYYGPVDYNGHYSGPNSPQTQKAVYDIDDILDKMQSKLKKAGLENEVNIMVVSDHGMTDVRQSTTKYIALEKFAHNIKLQVSSGASSMIIPEPGMLDKLIDDIKHDNIKGLQVFKKEDIPEMYHLKNNDRVSPLFLLVDKGFYIKALEDNNKRVGDLPEVYKGSHGYDPQVVEDMRTVFFARGPDFRKGFETIELYNTDLYNIMCNVLGLEPLPNNGSWQRVRQMLTDSNPEPFKSTAIPCSGCLYVNLLSFIFVFASFSLKYIA